MRLPRQLSRSVPPLCILWILCFGVILLPAVPQQADGMQHKRVFTSVTTDDVNRAAMAIKFTQSVMQSRNMQGVLFFNVYGVNLVNASKPSPGYGNGQTIATMLKEFMNAGGVVMACPMCMEHVGHMQQADLLHGVTAVKGGGVKAVSMPDTMVLSY